MGAFLIDYDHLISDNVILHRPYIFWAMFVITILLYVLVIHLQVSWSKPIIFWFALSLTVGIFVHFQMDAIQPHSIFYKGGLFGK